VAALNVSGPLFRLDGRLEDAASLLVRAADELSAAIGGAVRAGASRT